MRQMLRSVAAPCAVVLGVAAAAFAADEFKQVLGIVAKSFKDTRATMTPGLKKGQFPPQGPARELDDAQLEVAKTLLDCCDGTTRIGFPDASHWVDVKTLKDERWVFDGKVGFAAEAPEGAVPMFRAEWRATKGAEAGDVTVTVAELKQAVYGPDGRQAQSTRFADPALDVKNADVAGLLKACADAWAKTSPGAVAEAPAKKGVGAADWIAAAAAPAEGERAAARREWYAWETPGVSWRTDGTTWLATVTYSAAAAADPKATGRAATAALLKQIKPVLQ